MLGDSVGDAHIGVAIEVGLHLDQRLIDIHSSINVADMEHGVAVGEWHLLIDLGNNYA